jgi:hypothetical protein
LQIERGEEKVMEIKIAERKRKSKLAQIDKTRFEVGSKI